MRIGRVAQASFEYVDIIGDDVYEFKRHSPTYWEIRCGDCWEPLFYCEDVEKAYQEWDAEERAKALKLQAKLNTNPALYNKSLNANWEV